MFGKVSDYVLTINVLTVIINFSVVDHGRTWTKTGDFLNMKICGETFHICLRSCVSWAVFGHHSDETKETEPDIWMCFMQNTVCLSFCICTTNVAVCSKTIPFNVLTTNRPSFRKKNGPEMLFFFLSSSSSFVACLPKANNQDPIFNFTSSLCSADGCKLILWQRAATAPIRGSILSESTHWHQEQLQGGQRKVTSEMRPYVQKREPWLWCFQGRDWCTSLYRGKIELSGAHRWWLLHKTPWSNKASVRFRCQLWTISDLLYRSHGHDW